ncbi:hypothetical protein SPBR_02947 [Sporothrix brasiliensis 5110]|uniref:Uncharacterized protein n=1 Tax=Sporothrix brasiliensis 5110 TaxID=1398154 RepID=A0A0C2J7H8_9PEZI|nr:uncharacterized protein SPBR_02947 [Sporothrix brasiliensis 5110]KIH92982.1 hypothetical protein SPBR_02947 [Sporothrix brasiliensis 5110]
MQFTVFRTRGLPRSFEGYLAGKVVRSGSYADKNTANQQAEALLRLKGPPVARMEFEYGEEGSSRNGMFFGRAEYKNGTCLYVYVDCEYQQFGKIDPSEFDGKRINPQYKQLCLAPRYDVFVILRKAMRSQDGIVVYEYEEETRPETVADVIDDDDSDIESSHEKGPEIESEHSPVESDDSDRINEVSATENREDSAAAKGSDENDTPTTLDEVDKESSFARVRHVNAADDNCVDGSESNQSQSGLQNDTARPSAHGSSLGSHFQPIFVGSYTTLAEANAKAIDAFSVKTRPQPPARLDALMYYRDILQPHLRQLRLQFCADQDSREATKEAEISWEPSPQFRYDYEAINVVVAKSEMQGPLDLTGAFS